MAIEFEALHDVESEEEGGLIMTLRRRGRVTGLTGDDGSSYAAQAWASGAIPRGAIMLNYTRMVQSRAHLWVDEQSETGTAWIDLFYERGATAASAVLRKGGRVSARQAQTQRTPDGQNITVTYKGDTQMATINVMIPTAEPYIETLEQTNKPDLLALAWVGKVNISPWRNRPAGQWLCTDASYDEVDGGDNPPTYRFRWSFQLAEDAEGWLPVVAYTDPVTGQTPVDVAMDNGLKAIPFYRQADFATKF